MKTKHMAMHAAILIVASVPAYSDVPVIDSLKPNGQLTWTFGYNSKTNEFMRLEISTNLAINAWTPFFYDLISTNLQLPPDRLPVFFDPPTNAVRTLAVPTTKLPAAFFRTAIQNNIPDTNLVLHFTYHNDFSRGIVLDSSGYGNHGLRYGLTNWPSLTIGPDGSPAAEFHVFTASDPTYFGVGDYIAVLGSPSLDNLSQATFCVWAHYYMSPGGDYANDHTATLLDASWGDTPGSWSLGRDYGNTTIFTIFTNAYASVHAIGFPDVAPTGDTGGWHYYVVTFDGVMVKGYFDGQLIGTFSQLGLATQLRLGGVNARYIAISTANHDGTPQFNDDQYPNCCWMNGAIGDTRIYNRALSANEILTLYNSFDHEVPSAPTGLSTRAAADSQIELRWNAATDNFSVTGYSIRRGGAAVGTALGTSFVDTGLNPATSYSYTVEAFDGAGNRSPQSLTVITNTPPTNAPVSVVVDDEDGPERSKALGSWSFSPNATGSFRNGLHFGTESSGAQSVIYLPTLPGPGSYGVYLWYTGAISGGTPNYIWADNVPVDIIHSGVTNTAVVNEQQGYGTWVLLGNYTFAGTTNEYVRIRTTGTTGHGTGGYVAADAVMFAR